LQKLQRFSIVVTWLSFESAVFKIDFVVGQDDISPEFVLSVVNEDWVHSGDVWGDLCIVGGFFVEVGVDAVQILNILQHEFVLPKKGADLDVGQETVAHLVYHSLQPEGSAHDHIRLAQRSEESNRVVVLVKGQEVVVKVLVLLFYVDSDVDEAILLKQRLRIFSYPVSILVEIKQTFFSLFGDVESILKQVRHKIVDHLAAFKLGAGDQKHFRFVPTYIPFFGVQLGFYQSLLQIVDHRDQSLGLKFY